VYVRPRILCMCGVNTVSFVCVVLILYPLYVRCLYYILCMCGVNIVSFDILCICGVNTISFVCGVNTVSFVCVVLC